MEDEKENLFFEPHKRGLMKTPLKASTAVNLPLPESQPDFGPLTTPTKPKEIAHGEPWTPTANLKMLISAASPEIRSRDEKRGLFDNRNELPEAKDSLHVGSQRSRWRLGLWGGWKLLGKCRQYKSSPPTDLPASFRAPERFGPHQT